MGIGSKGKGVFLIVSLMAVGGVALWKWHKKQQEA